MIDKVVHDGLAKRVKKFIMVLLMIWLLAGCSTETSPQQAGADVEALPTAAQPTDKAPAETPLPDSEASQESAAAGSAEQADGDAAELSSESAAVETTLISTEDGLQINEDPRRFPLFEKNTLVYELPGMDEVEVINLNYAMHGDTPLTMDVYYPPGSDADSEPPVVLFGLGYRMSSQPLRNEHYYTSWGRLVAAAGMAGVVYDTEQPDRDIEAVVEFIHENADKLGVDDSRIGLWSSSGNVPTVMSYLMQQRREEILFSIYYYGLSVTPDHEYAQAFAEECGPRGCLVNELADATYVNPDMPLFIVRAGQDFIPNINEAMELFVAYAREGGAQVTVVDYEDGVHGFDTRLKSEEATQVVADTVEFMKSNFDRSSTPLVIHSGLLITATGEDPIPDGVVVIEDGLITAVGGQDQVTIPYDAQMIDAQGGAVLPGLIDAHTHVLNEITLDNGEVDAFGRAFYLELPLQSGVTTIRDVGSDFGMTRDVGELRAALDKLGNTVPTIVLTGPILAAPGSWVHGQFGDQATVVEDVAAAGEHTQRLLAAGVDQIKLLSELQTGEPNESLTAEQVSAVVEAARAAGAQVTIHAGVSDAEVAIASGVDDLAHWPISPDGLGKPVALPDELFDALISNNIPVVGTLNLTKAAEGDVRRFLDAGGTLVFGTDGPGTGSVADPYREINTMAIFDVTPMEIIQAATANAAAALGLGDTLGTLEVGKTADIIILEGNPLEDRRVYRDGPTVVIKGGELVPLDS